MITGNDLVRNIFDDWLHHRKEIVAELLMGNVRGEKEGMTKENRTDW